MGWYSKITKDISFIPDAVDYYNAELDAAKVEVRITGNVEKAAANMPGIVNIDLVSFKRLRQFLNILTLNFADSKVNTLENI